MLTGLLTWLIVAYWNFQYSDTKERTQWVDVLSKNAFIGIFLGYFGDQNPYFNMTEIHNVWF